MQSDSAQMIHLAIAGVRLEIRSDRPFNVPSVFDDFWTSEPPDRCVLVRQGTGPPLFAHRHTGRIHGIGPVWTCGRRYLVEFEHGGKGAAFRTFVEFNLESGEVAYCLGDWPRPDQFFDFVFQQTVKTYFLAGLENGLVLHASGIDYRGEGIGFVGRSGAGKTTLARLWQSRDGCQVLSDDTVVVTWDDGEFYLWGTPWGSGAPDFASPTGCKLSSFFFVDHGISNSAMPVSGTRALRILLSEASKDWGKENRLRAIDGLCGMDRMVRFYELRFVPDDSAIDFIINLVGS